VDDGIVDTADVKAGRLSTLAPPGSVTVAVDEKTAEGVAIGNRPSFLSSGKTDGGQWELHLGRLANHWYTEGQPAFEEAFEAAPKGRDIVSLFVLGLNPSIAPGSPQVEDLEAGAVCLGIGGNTEYGGRNRCPYLAWLAIGEATVAVDGEPLCDRGKIL
jgi:hypothetical protein